MRTAGIGALALLLLVPGLAEAQAAGASAAGSADVTVLRGPGSGPLPRLETAQPARALAGKRLWLVDEAAGTVVSCRNIGTANVGERRIRCTRGRLPTQ
jgi:hypothetical protein